MTEFLISTPKDARSIADIHIKAWRAAFKNIASKEFLDNLSLDDHASNWESVLESTTTKTLLFRQNGIAKGWLCFGRGRDEGMNHLTEVYALYVDPDYWRNGIGRALLDKARRLLFSPFFDEYLWVYIHNHRARRFYESMGYLSTGTIKTISWGGTTLQEIKYSTEQDAAANP